MDIRTKQFKNGEIAYILATEEPVFVINIEAASADKPTLITTRRLNRISGEYNVEYFFADELGIFEDVLNIAADRAAAERKANDRLRERYENETPAPAQKIGTLLN